ncbi:hypothetical protein ACFT30_00940 [Microbacterium ureisolvens]|uniref:hypothetical protein n=1 Tax=Microbacterium ureisolvens TaxID=2781186 RepID=UPI00362A9031
MFAVYAAEQQYHHDIWTRDREHQILASIRDRELAALAPHRTTRVVAGAARPQRAAWARPIGLRTSQDCNTACAVA